MLQGDAVAMTISISSTLVLLRRTLLIAFLLLFAYPLFAKRKDDVVVMKNGDKFTGEIKGLQYGELVFKSDYMKDSVHLDWKRVETLQSMDTFIVALSNGQRVTGLHRPGRKVGRQWQRLQDHRYRRTRRG
jgi:hypothetical protein